MKLIKRFIILSGENKGTLSLEKNALGVFVKFTSYGKALDNADLTLLIDQKKYFHRLKGDRESFKLDISDEINIIHAAVFFGESLIMYGTNDVKRFNPMEINNLKEKRSREIKKITEDNKIFTPLVKTDRADNSIEYSDDAIAEENYYEKEAALTLDFSLPQEQSISPSLFAIKYINDYPFKDMIKRDYVGQAYAEPKLEEAFTALSSPDIAPPKKYYIKRKKRSGEPPKALKGNNSVVNETSKIDKIEKISIDKHINAREGTFYEKCSEEIEKLFLGEREKSLEKIMPNSKWAKIEYGGGKYYVIGIIGKEYLCYGVPADFTTTPPKELKGYCWWLPVNPSSPEGRGYWIMYQSLITGESILPD